MWWCIFNSAVPSVLDVFVDFRNVYLYHVYFFVIYEMFAYGYSVRICVDVYGVVYVTECCTFLESGCCLGCF